VARWGLRMVEAGVSALRRAKEYTCLPVFYKTIVKGAGLRNSERRKRRT
jgi:hypothetical protein